MNNSLRVSMFDQWMGQPFAPTAALAGLALVIAACGGDQGATVPAEAAAAPAAASPSTAPAVVVTGPQGVVSSEEAEQIALAAVGEGTVTWITPEDDRGAAWEVEVTRPNGQEVDVLVAADGTVVGKVDQVVPEVGSDGVEAGSAGGVDVGGSDGVAVTPTPGAVVSAEEAKSAALAAVGEGTVTWITPEDDRGAAWEVEVTRPNGQEVDVLVAADGTVIR
jgi:uncharacterized membrane protein YkoI